MKNTSKKSKGFTLIELLVVIAIIGILTAIVTTNFTSARAKSRDAKRISDLAQIQLALELFFDRCNGYPSGITNLPTNIFITNCPSGITLGTYISVIPTDTGGTTYGYATNGIDYVLKAILETNNTSVLQDDIDGSPLGVDCSDTATNFYYCVQPK
ncbi:MAG: prepilin-type N-terminal cleavage/methylation domain-containing protein [Patescibacteria group bacterium]